MNPDTFNTTRDKNHITLQQQSHLGWENVFRFRNWHFYEIFGMFYASAIF